MGRNFNGSSDRINIVGGAFTPDNTGAYSIWTYVRCEDVSGSTGGAFIGSDAGGSNRNWGLRKVNGDGLQFLHFNSGGSPEFFDEANAFTQDDWIFIAVTKAGSGTAAIALFFGPPGELTETAPGNAGTSSNDAAGIQIGFSGFSGGQDFFLGDMAYQGIVNGTAFTLEEFNTISMLGQHNPSYLSLPLDGISSPEPDWSGNGRSGTITSGTTAADNPPTAPPFGQDARPEPVGGGLEVRLDSFNFAENATFGVVGVTVPSIAFTPGSGFAELAEPTGTNLALQSQWKSTNDTGVDWTIASIQNLGGIGVEIRHVNAPLAPGGNKGAHGRLGFAF